MSSMQLWIATSLLIDEIATGMATRHQNDVIGGDDKWVEVSTCYCSCDRNAMSCYAALGPEEAVCVLYGMMNA